MTTVGFEGNSVISLSMGDTTQINFVGFDGLYYQGLSIGTGFLGNLTYLSVSADNIYTDGNTILALAEDIGVDKIVMEGITYTRFEKEEKE